MQHPPKHPAKDEPAEPLYLRASGTSLLIGFDTGEPAVLHWGADLGPTLPFLSILTEPVPHSALAAQAGTPLGSPQSIRTHG